MQRMTRLTALSTALLAVCVLCFPAVLRATTTDATWVGFGNTDSSWFNSLNWNAGLVPDGVGAVARFTDVSGGPIASLNQTIGTLSVAQTITLDTLQMSDPLFSAIQGGTITLTGSATVFADGANFDLPNRIFPVVFASNINGITTAANNIGGAGSFAAAFAGTVGLNKTGDSQIQIDSPQFYSGDTTITGGGKIITTVGDSGFGTSGNITLNQGSIQVSTTGWTTGRNITVNPSGGSIYWVGSGASADFSGDISGSGTFILNGHFGTGMGSANIRANNSLAGTLTIGGGTVNLLDNGAFTQTSNIINSGTLMLTYNTGQVDRINDNAPILMRGAAVTMVNATAGAVSENLNSMTLEGATNYVTALPGSGTTALNIGTLVRNNNAGIVFRGIALGSTSDQIKISNGTSLLVGGVIPFAYANTNFTSTATAESTDNVLVSYGANGVAPITSYTVNAFSSTLAGATNVQISGSGTLNGSPAVSVSGDAYANALVLTAPSNLIAGSGRGMTIGSNNGGTIHISSGVLLSGFAGYTTSTATLNSTPGNLVNSQIDFGNSEGVIMTPSAVTFVGAIHGSGGLTKLGGRTATFSAVNDYTGTTVLTGFNRFKGTVDGNVLPADTGVNAFGLSSSAIILYGSDVDPTNPDGSLSGTGLGELASDTSNGAVSFNRPLDLRGGIVELRNLGSGTLTWNGTITINDPRTELIFLTSKSNAHMVVNSPINGLGHIAIGGTDADPNTPTWVDLMTAGTVSGGFELSGGTVGLGADAALGTGSVEVSGSSVIQSINSARTLTNEFVIYDTTLGIAGTQAMNFSGEINGRGGNYVLNISDSATTTFSGTLSGGGFFKQGSGTLVLSGNNTFTGQMNVGNGTLAGGVVILRSTNALGSPLGATGVNTGSTLALDGAAAGGSINLGAEPLYLAGSGTASLGALYNLSGNNVSSGDVRINAQYNGDRTSSPSLSSQFGVINVQASTSLTLNSFIIGNDPGAFNTSTGTNTFLAKSIGFQKAGAGSLLVGSNLLTTGTSDWNAAIYMTGSLDIQGGVVQIQSHAGVSNIANGHSIVNVASINFNGGSSAPTTKLDLLDNGLIVDYTGVNSPLSNIVAYIKDGRGSGSWDGNGITSTMIPGSPHAGEAGKTGLGYADTSITHISSFMNYPVDTSAVVVRYTYLGDTNLDGKVDVTDLGALASHWQNLSGAAWSDGDFNYDGAVDVTDLGLLATNWQAGGTSPLGQLSFQAALAEFGLPDTAVPEPATFAILSVAGLILCKRRSREGFEKIG